MKTNGYFFLFFSHIAKISNCSHFSSSNFFSIFSLINSFSLSNCGSILSLTFIIPLFPPEVNDFQPIFSGITGAHKFILRDCYFPFDLYGCLVGKIGKHFFLKLPLSIKNSSENVPYFWNCFVFTLLKNCAMLFAGGESRCL